MTPKTVLACLIKEDGAGTLSRAAASLAARFDAHLVGLHVMEGMAFYPSFPTSLPDSVYADIRSRQEDLSKTLQRRFDAATEGMGARAEWRVLPAMNALPADLAVESARVADLVVMSVAEGGDHVYQQRFLQEAIIRGAGRPVLILPRDIDSLAPKRAVVGWRDTPQATRALHDLLPLLEPGGALRLVTFGPGPRVGDAGDQMTDLAAALDRHGLEVEVARRTDKISSIAEALQDEARDFGADLLAVGAYGHSRLYDLILGAVSRDLLRGTRVPVLFSR